VADPDVTRLLWHHRLLPQELRKWLFLPLGWKRLEMKLGVSRLACNNTLLVSIYYDERTIVVSTAIIIVKSAIMIKVFNLVITNMN